ncbi:hypothetical protein LCGC14_1360170 [marine sediment metagenome]|uniref:Uncharacterized protein n=1 Tax=marine sediment metagenome TaxID=412755 RepID=A0A0F9MNQ5_9ZZZZ
MAQDQSQARQKQRERQSRQKSRRPVTTQRRTGAPAKPKASTVRAGIPKGLAAAAKRKKKPRQSPYLSYIRALHGRLNPSLINRRPSKLRKP